MKPLRPRSFSSKRAGFSLVEQTIVVVILGVLSMMAVPRYRTVVERAKSAEAFTFLAQVEGAQEQYSAKHGAFAQSIRDLQVEARGLMHFQVGSFTSANWQTEWELRLTRKGASADFGAYCVIWNQDGFVRSGSSVRTDLIPAL